MILGVGIDLVDIRRIQALIDRFGEVFVKRFFDPSEHVSQGPKAAAHYAKRFAAKEAFIKAKGGMVGFSFQDIVVAKTSSGQPYIHLSPDVLNNLWPEGPPSIHLSLTDEFPYAQAIVIVSSKIISE